MAIPYHSFADSKPFKFLVGQEHRAFYMHSRLASQLSSSMATLVEGDMIEAKEGYATFKDTDEDTFIRVIQFAYTGDYTVAEPDIVLSESDIVIDNSAGHSHHEAQAAAVDPDSIEQGIVPQDADPFGWPADLPRPEPVPEEPEPVTEEAAFDDWRFGRRNKKGKKAMWAEKRSIASPSPVVQGWKTKAEDAWESFQSKAQRAETIPWQPDANEDHCQDYTPVFLCHAKLYAFSDEYSIDPLQELVLQKLRLTLSRFQLHPQRVGDVVELLKYTYDNTTGYEEKIDKLRNLVSDYVVCQIEKMVHHVKFTELLENGDLVKDFVPKLVERRLD